MGRKKDRGEYNDFLDGEKLRDNAQVRTTLQGPSTRNDVPSPPTRRELKKAKGRKEKGGPKKPHLTHFLCLPLVNEESRPQFLAALEKFGVELQKESLVPAKAVRPVGTLHLTLGVMALDQGGLEAAETCLRDLDLRTLLRDVENLQREKEDAEGGISLKPAQATTLDIVPSDRIPVSIELEALIPMQQPHKTSILYAEPKDVSARLYPFASALRGHFAEKGFLIEDKRTLKLHATIVNTIYAKPGGRRGNCKPAKPQEQVGLRSESHGVNAKSWLRFDATQLIEKYRNFVWAEKVVIDRVQICKMGAKKIFNKEGEVLDEEYEVVAEKMI
ncbi:hypothetical protein CC78DRAFT_466291 [Lojkania enalia]|uniref:A-kinase anchor protein 7-like phosphoesterase domain-containing protein n=1 Tax=Lojkania enalia TaxID=147567 RepID=A0A9P4KBR9_9PLEO|nr:hypothetical protein CC78DRAFT_466291 [Didymosphaeria enalia]